MPVINNATVASGTGLSTQGNGGRKMTRLQNGALVSAVRSSTTSWRLLKSTNDGSSWSQIVTVNEAVNDLALASKGNDVHVVVSLPASGVKHYRYNDSGALQGTAQNVVTGQMFTGNVSLAVNESGTEIHASWSAQSKSNIYYSKGVISTNGSITWGAVEVVAAWPGSTQNCVEPSITLDAQGQPVVLFRFFNTDFTGSVIHSAYRSNGAWTYIAIHANESLEHQSPSAIFVPQSINGLANGRLWVAWHGKDATDTAKFNIRTAFSDDGGVTWSAPIKLTSGNTFDRLNVSLSADKSGKVFALYEDHQWAPDLGIRMRTFNNGSWGAEVGVATADTAEQHPSALVDYSLQMTTPPFVYTDTTTGIRFTGNFAAGATVSPASGALGNKETTAVTPYVVSAQSGTTITQIVERINGIVTNTVNNPASLSRTLTAPQATWDALAYFATHTASVTVTDSGGGQTVVTYSFDKQLATNASLLEAAKANTDARARISTKRDALAAQVGLSAGSTFDAIQAQLSSGAWSKVATGIASNAGSGTFAYLNENFNVTTSNSVSANLTFKARLIFIFDATAMTIYLDDPRQTYPKTVRAHLTTTGVNDTSGRGFKGDSNDARVDVNGFRLPVVQPSSQYSYIAFG